MRVALWRRSRRPKAPALVGGPGYYRSVPAAPLRSWQLRTRQFRATRLGRRGLDPAEVYGFLAQVACDMDDLRAELDTSRAETKRAKDELRRGSGRQAGMTKNPGRW